jgi:hypothetical protein
MAREGALAIVAARPAQFALAAVMGERRYFLDRLVDK